MGFFNKLFSREKKEKLDQGLEKTKEGVWSKITRAVAGKSTIDDEVLDNLEEVFITSDVGVDTTLEIIDRIQKRVAKDKYVSTQELHNLLSEEVSDMIVPPTLDGEEVLEDFQVPANNRPYVILVVGVNGVGKTTTIGKLAHQYKAAGNKVILGAADTFRAAAIDQLELWGQRAGVTVIKQQMGSDPAAVAFDTVSAAKAQNADVVIIDTAGRLHNKAGLMRELEKIGKVVKRVVPEAPQEVLLVLDGSTGQNAYEQAEQFSAVTNVNALAITKLDGTAKGGVVIGISNKHKIPIKYLGLGEKPEDLQIFNAKEFVKSLFDKK
ncbi:MAG: signal recognition particle-docking protein FtsY [Muribaculaceae bacterium]|nr:signal recognition particle-docking protein FtsY [Muribaculaceae bacterium]